MFTPTTHGAVRAVLRPWLLFVLFHFAFAASAQIVITNGVRTYSSLTSTTATLTGTCE